MVGEWRVRRAAQVVRQGGVIAYPTEAVWGVGCDPWDAAAVYRLLELKQRPVEKGLILVAADIGQFDFLLADLPAAWQAQLARSWPGPNTWLVPHQGRLPEWISGMHDSVALRVSDHPLVRALCAHTGPLVSTSANPAGRPAARSRLRVEQYFGDQLDGVLGGAVGGRKNPSLIRDLRSGQVIRPS
ncbi:L-threonylcarbamoyladenylate synthase [Pseudomonas sp. GCM10022188]|uniref:L-threonylcarbamoyladenylate synthase n=1 Tax=Pseudomonas TaxID=286 RepID=UPI001E5B8B67|nr:Sua5/YciO/YrdC/YwlC family protein [Pseudomonas oryzagri]MCC6075839.1 Sua5/YciO/YrdC/YwlC family protein [Pseudomonas oryzagri]